LWQADNEDIKELQTFVEVMLSKEPFNQPSEGLKKRTFFLSQTIFKARQKTLFS
jgi:hypothetical protein